MDKARRCGDCTKYGTSECDIPERCGPGKMFREREFACAGYEYSFVCLNPVSLPGPVRRTEGMELGQGCSETPASVETITSTGTPGHDQLKRLRQEVEDHARDFSEILDILVDREGEPETLEEAYGLVSKAAERVMFIRHHDYGPENIQRHGELGVAIRMDDKLARINNLLKSGDEAKGEPREDAYGDLANYGKIGALLVRGWWDLPYGEVKE